MVNILKLLYRRLFWSNLKFAKKIGVKVGKGTEIYTRYFGSEPYLIEIGDNVQIATDVRFFNHGSAWVFRNEFPDLDIFGKIKIGNNVYIGSCALILPGVTIGDNVIVAAGAVVTKSFDSNTIIGGNPARIIGNVDEYRNRIVQYNLRTKGLNYQEKKEILLRSSADKFISKKV